MVDADRECADAGIGDWREAQRRPERPAPSQVGGPAGLHERDDRQTKADGGWRQFGAGRGVALRRPVDALLRPVRPGKAVEPETERGARPPRGRPGRAYHRRGRSASPVPVARLERRAGERPGRPTQIPSGPPLNPAPVAPPRRQGEFGGVVLEDGKAACPSPHPPAGSPLDHDAFDLVERDCVRRRS